MCGLISILPKYAGMYAPKQLRHANADSYLHLCSASTDGAVAGSPEDDRKQRRRIR